MNLIEKEAAIRAIEQKAYGVGGVARTYYERAISALDDLPLRNGEDTINPMTWHVAKERPKKKGEYLVWIVCSAGDWMEVCEYKGRGKWASLCGEVDEEDVTLYVTHWMPLPERPE